MGPGLSSSYETKLKYSYPNVSNSTLLNTNICSMTIYAKSDSIFSHAGIIVYPDKVYETDFFHSDGVLIEYGDYDIENLKDHGFYYWYESKTGLRYVSTSDVLKIYGTFIPCEVKCKMTVRDLLNKICNEHIWDKTHYNFKYHNCQDFVASAIYFLKATRHNNFQKSFSYARDNVPPIIHGELRRNEFSCFFKKIFHF